MPLEIRELIIRTQIVSNEQSANNIRSKRQSPADTKLLIDKCVDKVLKVLKKKMDR